MYERRHSTPCSRPFTKTFLQHTCLTWRPRGSSVPCVVRHVQFFNSKALRAKQDDMISVEGLNHYFSRRYTREVAEGDESISASWKRIRHGLHLSLTSTGIDGVTRVKASEQRELQKVLDSDIPSLRRKAAPVQFSFFGVKKN